ncbi:MAG: AAA family ATPase [Culicoidibacterales bacterium]
MIKKISLNNIATYDQIEFYPEKINYIYGSNGAGKTTISKVIANSEQYSTCTIEESSITEKYVYNRDFVKENFSQTDAVPGIFTLGKENKNIKEEIEQKRAKHTEKLKDIATKEKTIEQFRIDIKEMKENFNNKAWAMKKRYEKIFVDTFKGYGNSKEKFASKLAETILENSIVMTFEDIEAKLGVVFDNEAKAYSEIPKINFQSIEELEKKVILSTPVVGKTSTQIGELIQNLGNSDWVNEGRKYLGNQEDICPFCQQNLSRQIKIQIEDFFDESYQKSYDKIETFSKEYKEQMDVILENLQSIIDSDIKIVDFSELKNKKELISEKYKINMLKIDHKKQSPSNIESLEEVSTILEEVNLIIQEFQKIILKNNELLGNLKNEQEHIKEEIWKYLKNELSTDICSYEKKLNGKEKAILRITEQKEKMENECRNIEKEIAEKEGELTSTQHTKNEMNRIIKKFGFKGFKVADADVHGTYKIVRNSGEDVAKTLSEGEYTFITFLYFYQLIKGSMNPTTALTEKTIVIDDPISSLDSDVLFIVSHLVKDVIKECFEAKNNISQVFVLTHNIYFYKEITFRGAREQKKSCEKYWIVKKQNNISEINGYDENQIQTTYEMLWREISDAKNPATIFNTMRRILEYYFNIIGGVKYEAFIEDFDDYEDRLTCKALLSWINDGSHFLDDPQLVSTSEETIERYMSVFEMFFEKTGHKNHYDMMMRR